MARSQIIISCLLLTFGGIGCSEFNQQAQDNTPEVWHNLTPGMYDVGFNVEKYPIDNSSFNNFPGSGFLQLGFWYPVNYTQGKKMSVKNYIDLLSWDQMDVVESNITTDTAFSTFRKNALSRGVDSLKFIHLINLKTAAFQNARPQAGNFPLIVIAVGYGGSLLDHFILAEYLASYGFVVGMASSVARTNPMAKGSIENYFPMMKSVIDKGVEIYQIDTTNIGLIGYSLCGACITLFHQNFHSAKALLSLDGWDGFESGVKYLNERMDTATSLNVPYAFLAEDPEIVKESEKSPTAWDHSIVRKLAAPKGLLTYFEDLRHIDFATDGMFEFIAPNYSFNDWQKGRRISSTQSIERIHQLVKLYMEGLLKNDNESLSELCELLDTSQQQGLIIESPIKTICNID